MKNYIRFKINRGFYQTIPIIIMLFSLSSFKVYGIVNEPNVPTLSLTATAGVCNIINISLIQGDGSRRMIIAKAGSPVDELPIDRTSYVGGSIFGTGTNLGGGNYVVYEGSGTSASISGLEGGTQYFFACFEYNGSGVNSNFLTIGYPTADEIAPGISMIVISSSADICPNDSVQLQASGAVSYSWTPSQTLSSSTDPIVTATPISTTTYTVTGTDSSGCQISKSLTITVHPLPSVSLGSFQNICINQGLLILSGGAPTGGNYFGDGITNNKLDPMLAGAGTHVINYAYSDSHGCSDTSNQNILIKNAPNAVLNNYAGVCIDLAPFALTGGTPSGGFYSGIGVNGNGVFNPASAGVGSHPINYIVSAQGCSDTAYASIRVNPLPVVSFSTLASTCLNTTPFTLVGGSPSGGTYSGVGVSANHFDPSVLGVGATILTYQFTDANGCQSSDTSRIKVNAIPTVSFATINSVCANTGPVSLTQGSPAGGTYSGFGVSGTTFYTGIAGPGTHALVYTYRDGNNCSNSATRNIVVNAIPNVQLGNDTLICSNAFINLNGGAWSTYSWSTGATTPSLRVDSTGRGIGTFRFILLATNTTGCANRDTVFVTIDICTGISNERNISAEVYPNPFNNQVKIFLNEKYDLLLFNSSGQMIIEKKNLVGTYSFGDELPSGFYVLKLVTENEVFRKSVIKN